MLTLLLLCATVFALGIAGGWLHWQWLYLFSVLAEAAPLAGLILTNMRLDFGGNVVALLAVLVSTLVAFWLGRQLARGHGPADT
jgi:hypothetical protein